MEWSVDADADALRKGRKEGDEGEKPKIQGEKTLQR